MIKLVLSDFFTFSHDAGLVIVITATDWWTGESKDLLLSLGDLRIL